MKKKSQCFTYDNTFGARNKGQLKGIQGGTYFGNNPFLLHECSSTLPYAIPPKDLHCHKKMAP